MKMLKSTPIFQSELDERRFWEMNDAAEYFDLEGAIRVATPNLRPSPEAVESEGR